jgi:protein-tyrosine phosphatase
MWSSWSEKAAQATKSMTEAFDSAGEAITQAASKAHVPKKGPMTPTGDDKMEGNISDDDDDILKEDTKTKKTSKPTKSKSTSTNNAPRIPNVDKEKFFKNFQAGWSSVVESTKRTIDETKKVVESNQIKFEQGITQSLQFRKKGFYKRDPTLPLDVQALRDAQVVYITDRIITMSHPAMASTINPTITGERKLAAIGHLLNRRHDGRFLVWNLSEIEYDIDILDDQVLTFSFPGSPSPPLGQLLKLLVSMENWMKADDRNVAVVHCLTGKGRTSTVLAAFLCWMGQAGFGDIQQAMEYIAHCKQMPVQDLIIPSQSRYASYFKNMLDGVRPSQPPLMLKRIIMSEAPKVSAYDNTTY